MLRLPVRREKGRPARKKAATPPMTKGNMQVRVVTVAALVALAFLVLGARLWYLQVLTGEDYNLAAQATKTTYVKIPAQRGVIYDRDGKVLANNVPGLNVTVIPDEISKEKVRRLAEIVGADVEAVVERYETAIETGNRYNPILVKENADRAAVTYVSERTGRYGEFRGVSVNDDWVRSYPEGELAAHVLGYTGAVTPDELKQKAFKGLSHDSVVGKSGIELQYEEVLRGKAGWNVYNVDVLGRIVPEGARLDAAGNFVDERGNPIAVDPSAEKPDRVEDPVPGKNLELTIDLDLQKVAEGELEAAMERARQEGSAGNAGAVVAMDPRNGEILAMASRPNFDPQLFVGGITGEEEAETFEYLNSEWANSPFTNRAIAGAYPGASTFKVFTGLAGFFYGVINASTTVTDTGACWRPSGSVGGCWQSWREYSGTGTTHGTQNYAQAIGDSNDKFFYQVADWIWQKTDDPNLLPEFYERFGFGSLTGIDLPGETAGRIPTKEWFDSYQKEVYGSLERRWGIGDWVNLSIGQGDLAVSPIQMVQAYSAVYNNGTLVTPHVAKEVRDQNGELLKKISPKPEGTVEFDPEARTELLKGLRMVTGPGGTAAPAFAGSKLAVLGKSGTGEVAGKDPVNWFAGWAANREERPLVVVVMVEGGGGSEVTAAPAVRKILEAYHGVEDE